MGLNTLSSPSDGDLADASGVDQFTTALKGDLVPRNDSGVPTSNAGALGTSTYPFKRAEITSGFFFAGMIMPAHSYNGTITAGQGWMLCDGRIINKTNYDTEHGEGSWDKYIVTSSLDGKYLPSLTDNKYLTGTDDTTQDGAAALTLVGNDGNEVDLSHSHTTPAHRHVWYYDNGGEPAVIDKDAILSGTPTAIRDNLDDGPRGISTGGTSCLTAGSDTNGTLSTSASETASTSSGLSSAQSIQPSSLEVLYYMRII